MIIKRRRFKQTQSLDERHARHTELLRERVKMLPPGQTRDQVTRRTENQTASHLSEWLRSPGLRPPE